VKIAGSPFSGVRSRIESGCIIDNSMGQIYQPLPKTSWTAKSNVPLGIGANTTVRRAIIDKTPALQRSNY